MTARLTDEQLAEAEAIDKARTPGLWRQGSVEKYNVFCDCDDPDVLAPALGRVLLRMNTYFPHERDAAAIENWSSVVTALLAEVRALRAAKHAADLGACACSQHGDYCPAHPNCICGCQRHAHSGMVGECIAGSLDCSDCTTYRPTPIRGDHVTDARLLSEIQDARLHAARVATIASEAFGPFPVQSTDDYLSAIERGITAARAEHEELLRLRAEVDRLKDVYGTDVLLWLDLLPVADAAVEWARQPSRGDMEPTPSDERNLRAAVAAYLKSERRTSAAMARYRVLEGDLRRIRAEHPIGSLAEDPILEEMASLWWLLSDIEREFLDREGLSTT